MISSISGSYLACAQRVEDCLVDRAAAAGAGADHQHHAVAVRIERETASDLFVVERPGQPLWNLKNSSGFTFIRRLPISRRRLNETSDSAATQAVRTLHRSMPAQHRRAGMLLQPRRPPGFDYVSTEALAGSLAHRVELLLPLDDQQPVQRDRVLASDSLHGYAYWRVDGVAIV